MSEDFQLIPSPAEAESHLNEAIRIRAAATVWTKNQKYRFQAHLFPLLQQGVSDTSHFQLAMPFGFNTEMLAKDAKTSGDHDLLLNVALSRANIFFKTQFVEQRADILVLRNPEKIYKVQRRKDMRFRIRDGYIVKVDFLDPLNSKKVLTHKMFDMSAGGCSFIVSTDDLPTFANDLELKNFTFQLNGRKLETIGVIRNKRPSTKNGYHYVGVQFKGLRAADSQFLAKFVFDENLKYLSRFL